MSKVSNSTKEAILKGIISKKWQSKVDEAYSKLVSACEVEAQKRYGKIKEYFYSIPKELEAISFFRISKDIILTDENGYSLYYSNKNSFGLKNTGALRGSLKIKEDYPCKDNNCYIFLKAKGDIKKAKDEYIAVLESIEKDANTINEVLNSCTTTKRLVELCPEADRFLPNSEHPLCPVAVETLDKFKAIINEIK